MSLVLSVKRKILSLILNAVGQDGRNTPHWDVKGCFRVGLGVELAVLSGVEFGVELEVSSGVELGVLLGVELGV